MQISKHKAVALDYTLTDDSGEILDSSKAEDPLSYLHGTGNLIPGLESALEGKKAGDEVKTTVAPDQAYGKRSDEMIQSVPKDQFEKSDKLEVGMRFHSASAQGDTLVTVTEISDDEITIDGNHPLAGLTLHFDVKIIDVRDATKEEIDHGHIHGAGGHNH